MSATVYTLNAPAGAFAFTGAAASFIQGYVFNAASGAFHLTGGPVGQKLIFAAGAGAFAFTGHAFTLTYVPHSPVVVAAVPSDDSYVTVLTSVRPLTGTFEMRTYTPGQTAVLEVAFLNTATQAPIAASAVELRVLDPSMRETDTTTSSFTNPSTGVYSLNVVVYLTGTWTYRWVATAPFYAAGEGSFLVAKTPFLVPY